MSDNSEEAAILRRERDEARQSASYLRHAVDREETAKRERAEAILERDAAMADAADCAENHYTAEEGRALEAARDAFAADAARLREALLVYGEHCMRAGYGVGVTHSPGHIALPFLDSEFKKRVATICQTPLSAPTNAVAWLDEKLAEARRAALEEAKQLVLGGRFLHDEAPTVKFAREVAEMFERHIAALATKGAP